MNKVIWWFYLSKGIELLDTIFFLLRKKFYKLSFLHIYNHATMFVVWWLLASGAWLPSGITSISALINSSLHILMYYYYAISAIGPSFQKYIWWKKYLTFFQMLQFAILIIYCSLLLYEECSPPVSDQMLWLVIYYSMSHVVLIYDFYTNTYYTIMYQRMETVSLLYIIIKMIKSLFKLF
jgi:elongation of very long chain fatty acids protein 4